MQLQHAWERTLLNLAYEALSSDPPTTTRSPLCELFPASTTRPPPVITSRELPANSLVTVSGFGDCWVQVWSPPRTTLPAVWRFSDPEPPPR